MLGQFQRPELTPAEIDAIHASSTPSSTNAFITKSDMVEDIRYNRAGILSVITGSLRYYPIRSCTLIDILVACTTAPTGSSLILNVLKNGVSIKTVTLTAGSNSVTDTFVGITLLDTDYLTIDITQVGSTIAGANLSARIRYS